MSGLNAGEVYALLGGKFDPDGFEKFGAAMFASGKRSGEFERNHKTAMDRVVKASKAMAFGVAGAAAVGVGALAVETLKAVKAAADFESAMRNVNTIAKVSETQLKGISKAVLTMAGKTGQAPKVLAEGLYDIVSSGFKANDALKILEASATAATAGLTDTATSTKAVVAVLNSYHMGADQAGKVSDQLFQIVNQGVLTFEELAGQIGDVLPFASSLGVGLDQLGGAIATITKGGTNSSQTMTQVKAVFNQLLSPSAALATAIKKTGSASSESLLKTKGFQGTLEALVGTTDGSKAAVQKLFPNVEALAGVLRLTGDNAKGARDDLKAMAEASGSTQGAFAEQSKSYEVQASKFSAAWQAARITVGEQILPVLTKKLGEWSKGLSDAIQSGDLEKMGQNLAKGAETALTALEGLARATPSIAKGMASGIDTALGVLTTFQEGILATIKAYNAIPFAPNVDTSEIERGIENINKFREALRGKPPTVKIHIAGDATDAIGALKSIQGTKLESKVMKILGSDGSLRSKLAALEALKIPPKTAIMLANVADALNGIETVNGALARMQTYKLLTVEVRRIVTGNLRDALNGPNALSNKPQRAAGRGPGRDELALVGEGPVAREAIVDPATGLATVVDGPTLMRIPDTAYVIPQDSRYRGRALGMLSDLANDLGLQGFKGGKKPKAKAKKQRYVPTHLEPLAFPQADFETKETAARGALNDAKKEAEAEPKKIRTKKAQIRDIERRKPKTAAQRANKADDLKRARADLKSEQAKLATAKAAIPKLRAEWQARKKELEQAKKYAAEIKRQQDIADTAADEMGLADRHDDQAGYETARSKRAAALGARRSILAKAKALAEAAGNTGYAATLGADIAKIDVEAFDTGHDKIDIAAPDEPDLTEAQKKLLGADDKAIALAALTETLADDTSSAQTLVSHLEGILGSLTSGAQPASDSLITDIAGRVKTARDNLKSLTSGGGTNDNPDLQAKIDQANQRTRAAEESARINAGALAVFTGASDLGLPLGRGGPTVVFQSYVPPSPQEAARLAGYTVGGLDAQGSRQSPRETVG